MWANVLFCDHLLCHRLRIGNISVAKVSIYP